MSTKAANRFAEEASRIINYHILEYDLTYYEAVGVLELLKTELVIDADRKSRGES